MKYATFFANHTPAKDNRHEPKYQIKLSEVERSQLRQFISSGTAPARKPRRAQILLKSDSSAKGTDWNYQVICEAFDVSNVTVSKVRRDYFEGGLETALNRKKPDRIYAC